MSASKASNRTYPKPVYAAAGAGELAMEQIRKLPDAATKLRTRVESELKKIDLADVRGKVQNELPAKMQTEFVSISDRVRSEVNQLRDRIADARRKGVAEVRTDADRFRSRSTDAVTEFIDAAQKQFKAASMQAVEVYEDLAHRGQKVIAGDKRAAAVPASQSKGTTTKASVAKSNGSAKTPAKATRSTRATAK